MLEPLLYIMGVLVGAWLFGFIAVIVGSPFHSLLNAEIHPPGNVTSATSLGFLRECDTRESCSFLFAVVRLTLLLLLSWTGFVH